MNQKLAWGMFFAGLAAMCYCLYEWIGDWNNWIELTTPQAVKHLVAAAGSCSVAFAGALGVDLGKFPIVFGR